MYIKPCGSSLPVLKRFVVFLTILAVAAGTVRARETVAFAEQTEEEMLFEQKKIINIMLIGQDRREGEDRQRSDTMILLTINKEKGTLQMTSFMRDLYVQIPGYGGEKMNAAYQLGGMELLDEVMESSFGIPIDGNIEVDFNGFKKCIDLAGGVDVELTQAEADYICGRNQDVLYPQPYREDWNLTEGVNHLDGEQTLVHVRNRSVGNSDYERTERQREVLAALFNAMEDIGMTSAVKLAVQALSMITTDLSLTKMMEYGTALLRMDVQDPESCRIPQEGAYTPDIVGGMDVLVPDLDACRQYLQDMIYGEDG